jgi:hypothetical protein
MPSLSRPNRPESRKSTPSLSGISEAYAAHILEAGPTKIAKATGEATSTVHGWSTDLHRWSLPAGLILARHVPSVGAAVVAYITGAPLPVAEPTAAISEAYETASRASSLINEILAAVQDGRIDKAESRRLVAKILSLAAILPQLERDVVAAAGGVK